MDPCSINGRWSWINRVWQLTVRAASRWGTAASTSSTAVWLSSATTSGNRKRRILRTGRRYVSTMLLISEMQKTSLASIRPLDDTAIAVFCTGCWNWQRPTGFRCTLGLRNFYAAMKQCRSLYSTDLDPVIANFKPLHYLQVAYFEGVI